MLSNEISVLFDRLDIIDRFLHSYVNLQEFFCCKIRVFYNILKNSLPKTIQDLLGIYK